jgi:hypothetical protein
MPRAKKPQYVFLVYCNQEPLVYGVYKSKQKAVRYAISLIRYRKERIENAGNLFGFYHFCPFAHISTLSRMKDKDSHEYWHDATVFTACVSEKDKDGKSLKDLNKWSNDGCFIRVDRRRVTC